MGHSHSIPDPRSLTLVNNRLFLCLSRPRKGALMGPCLVTRGLCMNQGRLVRQHSMPKQCQCREFLYPPWKWSQIIGKRLVFTCLIIRIFLFMVFISISVCAWLIILLQSREQAPRRYCCELMNKGSIKNSSMQLRIRRCRNWESITSRLD